MGIFAPPITANATAATVATSETTVSTSYADLATSGPSVTVTVGASGLLLVILSPQMQNSGANQESRASFVLSGANTLASSDTNSIVYLAYGVNTYGLNSRMVLLTGLTAGSTTVKMQYRVNAGTGTFSNRNLIVIPL